MLFVISFIIIITAIVIMSCVKVFNNISRYKVAIDESKANVDIALAKRCDTITQMLNVAKKIMLGLSVTPSWTLLVCVQRMVLLYGKQTRPFKLSRIC